ARDTSFVDAAGQRVFLIALNVQFCDLIVFKNRDLRLMVVARDDHLFRHGNSFGRTPRRQSKRGGKTEFCSPAGGRGRRSSIKTGHGWANTPRRMTSAARKGQSESGFPYEAVMYAG